MSARPNNQGLVQQPTKNEHETTIQDACNNWDRVYLARTYVNGDLLSIIRITQHEHGYVVRTPYYSRFNKLGPKYLDRLMQATTRCWVMWGKKKPHVPDQNPTPTPALDTGVAEP